MLSYAIIALYYNTLMWSSRKLIPALFYWILLDYIWLIYLYYDYTFSAVDIFSKYCLLYLSKLNISKVYWLYLLGMYTWN